RRLGRHDAARTGQRIRRERRAHPPDRGRGHEEDAQGTRGLRLSPPARRHNRAIMRSMFLRRLRAATGLLCLALLCSVTPAAAAPSGAEPETIVLDEHTDVVSLSGRSQQLIDPGGTLGIEEIEAGRHDLQWRPRGVGDRVRLEGSAALWVRFDVRTQRLDAHWELELARSGTDLISLYLRDASGRWRVQHAGDRLPVRDWANPDRYPVFGLGARAHETV